MKLRFSTTPDPYIFAPGIFFKPTVESLRYHRLVIRNCSMVSHGKDFLSSRILVGQEQMLPPLADFIDRLGNIIRIRSHEVIKIVHLAAGHLHQRNVHLTIMDEAEVITTH